MDSDLQRLAEPEVEEDSIGFRGPWAFLRGAAPGGFSGPGLHLILAWLGFQVLTSAAWAQHLQNLAGWSALPAYWGEQLTARDVWELMVNGKLVDHPLGFWTSLAGAGFLAWALWSGWKVQAAAAGQSARFRPWIWGLADAFLIGLIPLLILEGCLVWFLGKLGGTGIQGLGWVELVGAGLVRMTAVSAFLLQWWLCRAERAGSGTGTWRMGSWRALGLHLGRSFLRMWASALSWLVLLVSGVVLRLGMHLAVLVVAWRWGGGSPGRVLWFLALQAAATAASAWLMGWMLRVVGRFWKHDWALQEEIRRLRLRAAGEPVEA